MSGKFAHGTAMPLGDVKLINAVLGGLINQVRDEAVEAGRPDPLIHHQRRYDALMEVVYAADESRPLPTRR